MNDKTMYSLIFRNRLPRNVDKFAELIKEAIPYESQTVLGNTIEYISFNLISRGGNNIDIALFGTEDRQRSINAMRAMIKEKKTR